MASSVSFPTTSNLNHEPSPSKPVVVPRPPYQPFRRISIPSAPSPALRPVSVASLPEGPGSESLPPPRPRPNGEERKQAPRPGSGEYPLQKGKKANRSVVSFKTSATMDEQKLSKRNKIIDEFYETEKAYVAGLDLIYEHFLTPILNSLTTPTPLLTRAEITTIFSNFIDIWNLHRAFLSSFTDLLQHTASSDASPTGPYHPPLSPPLASHFPYLSLYTPFITAFPATLQTLQLLLIPSSPAYSPAFASFVAKQEKDPRCGKLRLRDWLLTIVQRCPRYLLLLKDLEGVEMDELEKKKLLEVKVLVDKITSALNTSLSAHLTTLSLLNLQRNTSGLPFQLITPGRSLIRRGTLYQVERSEPARERDFLLFSDCLVWIATEESEREWIGPKHWWQSNHHHHHHQHDKKRHSAFNPKRDKSQERGKTDDEEKPVRPGMPPRTRSKSEAGLSEMKAKEAISITTALVHSNGDPSSNLSHSPTAVECTSSAPDPFERPTTPKSAPNSPSKNVSSPSRPHLRLKRGSSSAIPRLSRKKSSRQSSLGTSGGGGEEQQKWVFKGRRPLVDMDIVVLRPPSFHAEDMTVEGGHYDFGGDDEFVDEDDESDEARKFEVHSPSGSFVLYASSAKERDEWVEDIRTARASYLGSLNAAASRHVGTSRSGGSQGTFPPVHGTLRGAGPRMMALPYKPGDERIGTLSRPPPGSMDDHYTEKRGKVDHFVPPIWIPDSKTVECMRCGRSFGWRRRRHHCRLCGRCVCAGCSERTFYISDGKEKEKPARACNACYETVFPVMTSSPESSQEDLSSLNQGGHSTIGSLTNFPCWMSMPSLPLTGTPDSPAGNAAALMAIDRAPVSTHEEYEEFDDDEQDDADEPQGIFHDGSLGIEDGHRVVKKRESSYGRPRSFIQIVEDFRRERPPSEVILNSDDEDGGPNIVASSPNIRSPLSSPSTSGQPFPSRSRKSSRVSIVVPHKRKEDTIRKKKRFSLPAVALHATSVTAHSGGSGAPSSAAVHSRHHSHYGHHPPVHGSHQHLGGGPAGYKREKRFSLVLGGVTGGSKSRVLTSPDEDVGEQTSGGGGSSLANGVAAGRLNQLLARSKTAA